MKNRFLFYFLPLCFFTQMTLAQPIEPATKIEPKTTDVKLIPKVIPDLPYKPDQILVIPSDVKGDEVSDENKPLDWTRIPPLSSKGPIFKPADDPAYD